MNTVEIQLVEGPKDGLTFGLDMDAVASPEEILFLDPPPDDGEPAPESIPEGATCAHYIGPKEPKDVFEALIAFRAGKAITYRYVGTW